MLANLTEHCDLNINFASTMTLDFAIRDKPVINLMFDCSDPPVFGMSMNDYIEQFEHYRPVRELGAARYARPLCFCGQPKQCQFRRRQGVLCVRHGLRCAFGLRSRRLLALRPAAG